MIHHEIQQFHFPVTGETVRTVITDTNDTPWFIAKDVCDLLDLKNPTRALSGLEDDEKNTLHIMKGTPGNPIKTVVSESGLYTLIMKSKKPEATKFRRWVTGEVLPTIRKTGGTYMTDEALEKTFQDPDYMIGVLQQMKRLKEERDELARTKAHISDKKTATAMATASAAVRRERKILDELEQYKQKYEMSQMKTVASQMPTIRKYFKAINKWFPASLIGKELKAISDQMGLKVDQVPDERWEKVNRYHEDAFLELLDRAETLRLDQMSLIKYVKDSVVKEAA